jgi:hypothetical protein
MMDIIPRARRDPLDGTIHGREKTIGTSSFI